MGDDVDIGRLVHRFASKITEREYSLNYVQMHTNDENGVFLLYERSTLALSDEVKLQEILSSGFLSPDEYKKHLGMGRVTPVTLDDIKKFGFTVDSESVSTFESFAVVYFATENYLRKRVLPRVLK